MDPQVVKQAIRQSPVGKKLPDHLYVHETALDELPDVLMRLVVDAEVLGGVERYDLAKIARDGRTVSLLGYPEFFEDPHPALAWSVLVNLETGDVRERSWSKSASPPILHRKETFLSPSHPRYDEFAELTRQEADLGLLSRPSIGTRRRWDELLEQEGVYVGEDHQVRTAAVKVDPVRILQQAHLEGFGGNCGWTAIIINEELFDGAGEYVGSFNRYRLEQFGDHLGHVVVKYKEKFYDGGGEISQEDLLDFGMLPPDDPDYFDQELNLDQESVRVGYDVANQSDLYEMSRDEVLEHMGGSCWVSPEELREQLQITRDAVVKWVNRKGARTAGISLVERIQALIPKIVERAQKVLDDWVQDEEGYSEEYGSGGVCHIITEESFQSVLADAGIDSTSISSSHEVHVYAIAFDTDTKEAALVDIRPWCYETGGGYTWRKIPEVVLEPEDVVIEDHDYDDVRAYLEEEGGW